MSRELGSDPLGIDPTSPAQVERVRESGMQRSIDAYRQGLLLRGTSMVGDLSTYLAKMGVSAHNATKEQLAEARRLAVAAAPAAVVLDDDGKPLTDEGRKRIAAERKPFDPSSRDLGYSQDLQDRKVEAIGESAQKAIDAQPALQVVRPRSLDDVV